MNNSPSVEDLRSIVEAAKAAQTRGETGVAVDLFRRALEYAPERKSVVATVTDGLRECGYWSEAVTILEESSRRWPVSAMVLGRLARAYMDLGDLARAGKCVRQYLDHDPRDSRFWELLGELHRQAGELPQAEVAFGRALAVDPLNTAASIGRAEVFAELGRNAEATVDYRRAEALEPTNAVALFKFGVHMYRLGSPADAAELLRRAVEIDMQNIAAHSYLSLSYNSLGYFDAAAQVANAIVSADPSSIQGRYALGMALIGLGDLDAAAATLKSAASDSPHRIDILMALAEAESSRGDPFAAERALQQVLAADPAHTAARFMIAAIHGEPVEAPPPNFAQSLFDKLAPSYDARVAALGDYRPAVDSVHLLEETFPELGAFGAVIDLGCGTGLAISALRDAYRIDSATGIDVSARMIEIASKKNLYDRLLMGDAAQILESMDGEFDLLTAIELAPYVGDLTSLFRSAARRLAPRGLFLCSIEQSRGTDRALEKTGRFSHSADYVKGAAQAEGLEIVAQGETALQDGGHQASGLLFLLRRP